MSAPTTQIRDARADDLAAIVEIYNATIPERMATADLEPVSVADRAAWLAEHHPSRRPVWVAECDGAIVGWLSLSDFYGRPAYAATVELGIYVAERARGHGVGGTLLRHAIDRAPALGISTLLGFVFAHNDASLRLLERWGFERWGELPAVAELDGLRATLAILGRRV